MESIEADRAAWAVAKIGRARQHGLELQGRLATWAAIANPRPVATISSDRLSWEVRLSKFDPPPLLEWALILGDAIHNLRAALDVLVWAHADEAGLTTGQAKSIAFPVWTDESAWNQKADRTLKGVPLDVVARIRQCQPFERPAEERSSDPLVILSDLDNRDKHRLALTTIAELHEAKWQHAVEFADEEASRRNVPPNVTVHSACLEPSALLLSGTTVDPVDRVAGNRALTWQVGIDPGNGFIGFAQLIEALASYVLTVVAHVAIGSAAAQRGEHPTG
ncbi:hypothetical protein [Sporichthya polymorpha]|uniref:hypothetical protein n=1 Tax=Sporichthya polymorpha TaxID=35751 RepID=UPI00036D7F41|nr:hypothetical protein [Sporichthya polymorpha]